MPSWPPESGSSPEPAERFPTTNSQKGLAVLCEKYWDPLYAYLHRSGYDIERARNFVQGFSAELLEKGLVNKAKAQRVPFRSFLPGSLKYYLSNERRRDHVQKRGEGLVPVSFDPEAAEGRYRLPRSAGHAGFNSMRHVAPLSPTPHPLRGNYHSLPRALVSSDGGRAAAPAAVLCYKTLP